MTWVCDLMSVSRLDVSAVVVFADRVAVWSAGVLAVPGEHLLQPSAEIILIIHIKLSYDIFKRCRCI